MNKKVYIFIFCAILAISSLWYFQHHQPSVDYSQCELCDGRQYLKAYQYFSGQSARYNVKFPFHSRVLVPWLTAQLSSNDANQGFVILLWIGAIQHVRQIL